MGHPIYCYVCKKDGTNEPIADLHWHGLGVHPRCLIALEANIAALRLTNKVLAKKVENLEADIKATS